MNGLVKVGAALAAAAIAGTTALTMMVGTALSGATAAAATVVPPPPTVCDVATVALTAEQTSNAQIIVSVGQQLSVGVGGLEVALITAIVESGLRNLNHGDADSLGLFQQRPSQGWGTPAQIMDPTYASTRFYQALTAVPKWTTMDPGVAAQTVQRSAFPARYDLAIPEALGILGGTCTPTSPGPPAAGAWTTPEMRGSYTITSEYGWRFLNGVPNFHGGTDFAGPCGTLEVAAGPGVVTHAGPGGPNGGWAGNSVTVDHGGGVTTIYAHQMTTTAVLHQPVTAGTPLGLEGSTGNSTGCHLHFETRVNDQPVPTRPFMAARGVTF